MMLSQDKLLYRQNYIEKIFNGVGKYWRKIPGDKVGLMYIHIYTYTLTY